MKAGSLTVARHRGHGMAPIQRQGGSFDWIPACAGMTQHTDCMIIGVFFISIQLPQKQYSLRRDPFRRFLVRAAARFLFPKDTPS
jgi:hypothetical protein